MSSLARSARKSVSHNGMRAASALTLACWAHHTPLVLLPGIWERWQYLEPLARTLHGYGHPVHFVPALGSNGAPLDASALSRCGPFWPSVASPRSCWSLIPRGGLIGKLVMLDPDAGARVCGMVALSTPFGGSSLSWPVFRRSPLGCSRHAAGPFSTCRPSVT